MTISRDDVIRLAREAGFDVERWAEGDFVLSPAPAGAGMNAELERFAALVAAAEREACAAECEARHANGSRKHTHPDDCAAAIRERGAP